MPSVKPPAKPITSTARYMVWILLGGRGREAHRFVLIVRRHARDVVVIRATAAWTLRADDGVSGLVPLHVLRDLRVERVLEEESELREVTVRGGGEDHVHHVLEGVAELVDEEVRVDELIRRPGLPRRLVESLVDLSESGQCVPADVGDPLLRRHLGDLEAHEVLEVPLADEHLLKLLQGDPSLARSLPRG